MKLLSISALLPRVIVLAPVIDKFPTSPLRNAPLEKVVTPSNAKFSVELLSVKSNEPFVETIGLSNVSVLV